MNNMNHASQIALSLHNVTAVECAPHHYRPGVDTVREAFSTNTLTITRGDAADPVQIVLFCKPGVRFIISEVFEDTVT